MQNSNDQYSEAKSWDWVEGKVNKYKNYFRIYHNTTDEILLDDDHLIALVAPPNGQIFNVTFLIKPSSEENKKILSDVKRELDFYINDKNEPDAYRYLQYHCTTASNIYSRVHWTEFQARSIFEYLVIFFHSSIFIFLLWFIQQVISAYDTHPISTDDVTLLWVLGGFALTSFVVLIAVVKRLSWSRNYAKKLMYLQMLIIGLPLLISLT